jgi:hypothetical protein
VASNGPPRRPARPGRVSLKGKGADIFFGDYTPPGLAEPTTEPVPEAAQSPAPATATEGGRGPGRDREEDRTVITPPISTQARLQADVQAAEQDILQAAQQESIVASKSASRQERLRNGGRGVVTGGPPTAHETGPAVLQEVPDDVWDSLEEPATITNSFRYTDAELSTLTDVLYQIGKQQGAKISKQEVARLGLNVVLDDYHRRGPASLLGQLAARRRRTRPARGG